ncbi:uncharacterized protein PHACADRAFT_126976 [Phanerochaete carnosa HHB-10118-sp]|uniref:Uncharacterized protein n=1 Tax=Phanerochaete carnosa (strain HHB-10118-sp) TaxID=650164 RepID=K5VN54_PHACS|nr:uncharacterized protein PHACADRAFT_126976 [Phanerochaete carnosa HHB-10118-sp]EKM52863.1 hypothetical protein PHACADRAFT_126976 [Phanerochaete carnosa HHB-10118-sp]
MIRPALFRYLILRSPEDVRFLKCIVVSPRYITSSLSGAISCIDIYHDAAESKPWLHHIHGLSARLWTTSFKCTVTNRENDSASIVGRWAPFDSLPSITPSYVPLTILTLNKLVFTSTTELARLVDSFSTLEDCRCDQLTFLDPSLVVQSRRARRRSSSSLEHCAISRCKGATLSSQATLASDILSIIARLGLDDRMWNVVLQALLALVPDTFERVLIEKLTATGRPSSDWTTIRCTLLAQESDVCDYVDAVIKICRPKSGPGILSPLAYIERITLVLSIADVDATGSPPFEAFQGVVDSPHLRYLRLAARTRRGQDYETMKNILCSVLRRTQLTWALESHKLQFGDYYRFKHNDIVTSADILAAPAEHTINDTTITLDTAEQAEWLLRSSHQNKKAEYLRELVTARASEASTNKSPGVAPSGEQ